MNKYEVERIQKWIESIEFEIQSLIDVSRYYKEDAEMMSYFQGREEGYKDALETFEFFLNEWKKCKEITPDRQEHHSNSDPKSH